jgi:hypothetical protein
MGKTINKLKMKNKDVVVFLSGKIGSGKDTTADALGDAFDDHHKGARYMKVRFADALKAGVSAMTGVPLMDDNDFSRAQKEGLLIPVGIDEQITLREFLQKFGTEAIRSVWNDFWIARAIQTCVIALSRASEVPRVIVITDCRFKNELSAAAHLQKRFDDSILLNGTKVVTVRLEGNPAGVIRPEKEHASETDLDDMISEFNLVINTEIDGPDVVARKIMEKILE